MSDWFVPNKIQCCDLKQQEQKKRNVCCVLPWQCRWMLCKETHMRHNREKLPDWSASWNEHVDFQYTREYQCGLHVYFKQYKFLLKYTYDLFGRNLTFWGCSWWLVKAKYKRFWLDTHDSSQQGGQCCTNKHCLWAWVNFHFVLGYYWVGSPNPLGFVVSFTISYTPIPNRPRIARIATNWFFLFGGIREVSLFFFLPSWCSTSQSRFRYDVVTNIRGNRLNSAGIAQEFITISKITLEHAAWKLRNQLRIS